MQTFFLKVFDWIGGSMYVHVNVLYNPIINFDLNSASYIPIGGGGRFGDFVISTYRIIKTIERKFSVSFFFFAVELNFSIV